MKDFIMIWLFGLRPLAIHQEAPVVKVWVMSWTSSVRRSTGYEHTLNIKVHAAMARCGYEVQFIFPDRLCFVL